MVIKEDLTWGVQYTIKQIDDVLQKKMPSIYEDIRKWTLTYTAGQFMTGSNINASKAESMYSLSPGNSSFRNIF